jgi:inorganic pyrophosphatase/exopolyphosphatase
MIDTIITAKNNPDLDGVASAIAYAYFLNSFLEKKKYFVAFWWQMQYEALYVLKMLWLQKADRNLDSVLTPDHKHFILVDYSEKEWISK